MKYVNELLNESFETITLENGLTIYYIEKPDYHQFSAAFKTSFGSNITKVKYDDQVISLPNGIAHFLEHKLFSELDEVDATLKFSLLGLECNAFTTNNETVYFFSGTKNFYKGLEVLLDFVQSPNFTPSNILSEIGIIEQELKMYNDDPIERITNNIRDTLFVNHPIKYDIGGTVEDINSITKENLDLAYKLFYHPSNMKLFIAGNFKFDEIVKFVSDNQSKKQFEKKPQYEIIEEVEPASINYKEHIDYMDIFSPKLAIGIKLPCENEENPILTRIYYNKILSNTFLSGSPFTKKLLKKGLINNNLNFSFTRNTNVNFIIFVADTTKPIECFQEIEKEIRKLASRNISKAKVEAIKKACIGSFIQSLSTTDEIVFEFQNYLEEGLNLFEFIDIFNSIDCDALNSKRSIFKDCELTYSIIYPKTNKKDSV